MLPGCPGLGPPPPRSFRTTLRWFRGADFRRDCSGPTSKQHTNLSCFKCNHTVTSLQSIQSKEFDCNTKSSITFFFSLQHQVHLVCTTAHLVGALQRGDLCWAVKAHARLGGGVGLCGRAGGAWQQGRGGDAGGGRRGRCQARENADSPWDPRCCSWQEAGRVDAQVGLEGEQHSHKLQLTHPPTVSSVCCVCAERKQHRSSMQGEGLWES